MYVEFVSVLSRSRRGFSSATPVSPLLENQYFQIPIRPEIRWTKNQLVDVIPLNRHLFIIYSNRNYLVVRSVHGTEPHTFRLVNFTVSRAQLSTHQGQVFF